MTMQEKTLISRKGKRGPVPTGRGAPVLVRFTPSQLEALDQWRALQGDKPSRPEALRRLMANALV